jgi:hypothetical protein
MTSLGFPAVSIREEAQRAEDADSHLGTIGRNAPCLRGYCGRGRERARNAVDGGRRRLGPDKVKCEGEGRFYVSEAKAASPQRKMTRH